MAKVVKLEGNLEVLYGASIDLYRALSIDETTHFERYEVAADATDESINFGPITTASVVYLSADGQLTYKLNGSSDSITLSADAHHVLMGTSVTSISVTEPNSSAVVLEVFLGGT